MQTHIRKSVKTRPSTERDGSGLVLGAASMVMLFAFTAFAVDIGYITLTKAELQKTADAAAMAATIEMYEGWGAGATLTTAQTEAAARQAAVDVAALNRAGGHASTYVDPARDVRLGNAQWDATAQEWIYNWGVAPYNIVEVTVRRDQTGSALGDEPLDLFFAPIIGNDHASLTAVAVAGIKPGVGVRKIPGLNVGVLPIALDVYTWDAVMAAENYNDNFTYNDENRTVTTGGDNIREINIYPEGSPNLPPGNRGTVDFGLNNNSTADISRQIRYGLNEADMEALGGELRFDMLPMEVNGDTGISAGIKDDLEYIKGQPRLLPLFDTVSGPGNNAYYNIVRFVPVRIVYVKLTGKPAGKKVLVQPCPYTDPTVISGETIIEEDSILSPLGLLR
ncbi:MAG: TadG family pilus assembly protein [Planctomycetaceae bacterium]